MNAASESRPVEIAGLAADDWAALRDVRLHALRDAPTAFGSSYEAESVLDDAGWRDKARRWTDPNHAAAWTARSGDEAVGLLAATAPPAPGCFRCGSIHGVEGAAWRDG